MTQPTGEMQTDSPCPNCGRSDGWHKAEGHPPPPVGDSRKIVWLTDGDMDWWGVRAYGNRGGRDYDSDYGWMNNGQKESAPVLFWMDGPHNPNYPAPARLPPTAPGEPITVLRESAYAQAVELAGRLNSDDADVYAAALDELRDLIAACPALSMGTKPEPAPRETQKEERKMLNGYPLDWSCTECAHANQFHHDVSGRCTISRCACREFSPAPVVPENPNSDKHHLAAKSRPAVPLQVEPATQGIYVASRASIPERSAMWRSYRDAGLPIISSWIDRAGEGETPDISQHWKNIVTEIAGCKALVLYVEPQDLPLKGAFVEVGMALAGGKPIYVAHPGIELETRSLRPIGSWMQHPLVTICDSVEQALGMADLEPVAASPAPPSKDAAQLGTCADRPTELHEQGSHDACDMFSAEAPPKAGRPQRLQGKRIGAEYQVYLASEVDALLDAQDRQLAICYEENGKLREDVEEKDAEIARLKAGGWIDCKQELPPEHTQVLVWEKSLHPELLYEDQIQLANYIVEGEWGQRSDRKYYRIEKWRPLPDPPSLKADKERE